MGILGAKYEKGGAMLTPNKPILSFRVLTSVPILVKIDKET